MRYCFPALERLPPSSPAHQRQRAGARGSRVERGCAHLFVVAMETCATSFAVRMRTARALDLTGGSRISPAKSSANAITATTCQCVLLFSIVEMADAVLGGSINLLGATVFQD